MQKTSLMFKKNDGKEAKSWRLGEDEKTNEVEDKGKYK
jgi:hypothetical protein